MLTNFILGLSFKHIYYNSFFIFYIAKIQTIKYGYKEVKRIYPKFGKIIFSRECTIIGDVVTGDNCSIWFQVVIRGDVNSISIGNKVNIQDGVLFICLIKAAYLDCNNVQ